MESIIKSDRRSLFPIQYKDIWDLYKKQEDCIWRASEIDLTNDRDHYNNLTKDEKYFINHILAFFASSDDVVIENLMNNFMSEVSTPEIKYFYSIQSYIETVHAETYSLLIDSYIQNKVEKNKLFNSINNFPTIKNKTDWALKYMNEDLDFATRLVAFAVIEGIFFSGAFCSIFWLKKRGLMPGLTFSNELISRDEALHVEFAVLLYNKIKSVVEPAVKFQMLLKVRKIIKSAVEIEKEFIIDSLPCRLIGMNSSLMSKYIEFVADRLSVQLGGGTIYDTKNPFDFMEMISLSGKTNFFEKRVGEYAMANKEKDDSVFDLTFDF